MKMRQLEAETGVNRETIRVFLRHGLIPEPSRPKPNVADYSQRHIDAINAVRELQRNSSLTMKQIKGALQGQQGGPRVDAVAFQHLEALLATRVGIDVAPIRLKQLAKAYPDAPSDATKLAEIGVIEVLDSKSGPSLSITDARLVTIWSEMRQAGFNEEHGFTPEMLTFYLEPAETVARNEATMFLERVEGRISEDVAAAMLQIGLRQMADFWGLLRMKRFLAHIHREPVDQSNKRSRKLDSRSAVTPKAAK